MFKIQTLYSWDLMQKGWIAEWSTCIICGIFSCIPYFVILIIFPLIPLFLLSSPAELYCAFHWQHWEDGHISPSILCLILPLLVISNIQDKILKQFLWTTNHRPYFLCYNHISCSYLLCSYHTCRRFLFSQFFT